MRAPLPVATAARTANDPPHPLLWATGIIAVALAAAAFVLWGVIGPGTLFDLAAALCP
jgi:hypothetical protein